MPRQPFRRPPLGSQLSNHSITRGLVGFWLFNEGAGNAISLVDPADSFVLTGDARWGGTADGPVIVSPNSGSLTGALLATPSAALKPAKALSLLWRGTVVAEGTRTNNPFIFGMSYDNANGNPYYAYGFQRNNFVENTPTHFFSAGGNVTSITGANNSITDNYGRVTSSGFTYASGASRAYHKGRLVNSGSDTGDLTYSATAGLCLNRHRTVTGDSCNTISEVAGLWNRVLDASEYEELDNDPYCIIAPPYFRKYFFFPLAPPAIEPTGIASAEAFGTPAVRAAIGLSGIASLEAFGTLTVLGNQTVTLSGIASLEAFGTGIILAGGAIQLTGIAGEEAFGTPIIRGGPQDLLIYGGIPSGEAFGFPAIVYSTYQQLRVFRAGIWRPRIALKSLTITERLSGGSTTSFTEQWPRGTAAPDRPVCGQEIKITEGRTEFIGEVETWTETITEGNMEDPFWLWKIECRDVNAVLDRRDVTREYDAGAVAPIVQDLVASFLTGENITSFGVNTTATIPASIKFTAESIKSALDKLAQQTGAVYGINKNRDLYFFVPGDGPDAPFGLTDTSANVKENSMSVTRSNVGKANQVTTKTKVNLG